MPLKLLFGNKPWLPSFPNLEIQRIPYSKSTSAKRYQLLQKLHLIAKKIANKQGDKINQIFDKNAFPHIYQLNELMWYEDFAALGKNAKLMPNWQGPAKITELNDTNAYIL
jgi:hypothetical protein